MLNVNLEKCLGDFTLRVAFEIGSEILVLFGPSGAGKTITLNCLAGLVTPDRGRIHLGARVLFDGDPSTALRPFGVAQGMLRSELVLSLPKEQGSGQSTRVNVPTRARHIGYVFQNYALFPHLTVRENVAFGVRRTKDARARVDEMLALVGLTPLATRYPSHLSGGQQQRVALARALAPRPDLLLLDEPFSALDAPTRMQLRHELRDLQREFKIPIVFVTHDLGEAYFLADKLAVLDRGELLQVDVPGEILRKPRDLRVARAVGVKNIFAGVVAAREERGTRVRVGEIALDAPPYPVRAGENVSVCVRPERIMLLRPERAGKSSDENALAGEIVREMSDGTSVTLYFRAARARIAPEQEYDLQIELPVYIYERLNLARERQWMVSVRKNGIHLIAG